MKAAVSSDGLTNECIASEAAEGYWVDWFWTDLRLRCVCFSDISE